MPLSPLHQFSLCTVDLDQGTVECPDELPVLPDMERLILQVSEKVQEHSINCPDINDLPPSTEITHSKHSIIEAIKYVVYMWLHMYVVYCHLCKE